MRSTIYMYMYTLRGKLYCKKYFCVLEEIQYNIPAGDGEASEAEEN